MKVKRGPFIVKKFTVPVSTAVITVAFDLWNQWFAQGGSCSRILQVQNLTKGTQVTRNETPGTVLQVYPTKWNFALACDPGDIIQLSFNSPDPGRLTQYVRVRNVVIDTTGTGS